MKCVVYNVNIGVKSFRLFQDKFSALSFDFLSGCVRILGGFRIDGNIRLTLKLRNSSRLRTLKPKDMPHIIMYNIFMPEVTVSFLFFLHL